jgi:hypothetical protein
MKSLVSLKWRLPASLSLAALAAALYATSLWTTAGADPKPDKKTEANPDPKDAPKTTKKTEKKKLTGNELYSIHCNRCHSERYPTEFTAAQWKTIMIQMRVRANLPADQAKTILKYLTEEAGK